MKTIPIVFAFDNNFVFPACVCISSLMMNAKSETFYDIFILHSDNERIDRTQLDKIPVCYPNCRIQYRQVGTYFDRAFEIRGVTTPTYYRLLIPDLIAEYDKVIYSDVDVIFRTDLSEIYDSTDISDAYLAGVNSLSHFIPDYAKYYSEQLGLDPKNIFYAGNLIINSAKMRRDNMTEKFKAMAKNNYVFQDMDIINVACRGKIKSLSPSFCLTNYINNLAVNEAEKLKDLWSEDEIREALNYGIAHYNGQKPWKGYCPNFDIWWEYYRKSPFFDAKFYFEFFNEKLNEFDHLSLWKRVKILLRWFFVR